MLSSAQTNLHSHNKAAKRCAEQPPLAGQSVGNTKDEFESSGEVPPYLSLIMLALDTKDFFINPPAFIETLLDCGKG